VLTGFVAQDTNEVVPLAASVAALEALLGEPA
jgi:hypothetical protein